MEIGWDFTNPNAPASRRDITWNADNMPVSIKYTNGINNVASTTLFAYDGNGSRVKKTAASGASTAYISGALEIISGVKTRYIANTFFGTITLRLHSANEKGLAGIPASP